METIRIGTRGSALALWQAHKVKTELENRHPQLRFELVEIKTKGDKILDVALSKIGDKGLFTKELEIELFEGRIDMAVHSLKDLPTVLPQGARLGAILERGEYRDAIVSLKGKTLATLDATDRIATSSLRRRALLLHLKPQLNIVDIRGNVNTRLRKMEEGYCDVMVMAAAGLIRLGLQHYITEIVDPRLLIPACGQGAVAVEIRDNDARIYELTQSIHHQPTAQAVLAERTFLNKLEGGCQIPIGAYTRYEGKGMVLEGFVSSADGRRLLRTQVEGTNPQILGTSLADYLGQMGGHEIVEQLRSPEA